MAFSLNPSKIILVTDAMSAMGLGCGKHMLGSMSVTVKSTSSSDGERKCFDVYKATIDGTDTLAGSVISMDQCVRNLKKFTDCTAHCAIKAATLHPAKVLKKCHDDDYNFGGSIKVGALADIILLDKELNVMKVFVNGKIVYDSNDNIDDDIRETSRNAKKRKEF